MKKIIFILLGMILLVGIISAGVSLYEKESEYIKTEEITILNNTKLIYHLMDDNGKTFEIKIKDDCKKTPIYEWVQGEEMPCMAKSNKKCYSHSKEIKSYEDTCYKEVIKRVKDYYDSKEIQQAKVIIIETQDENLENKIIDKDGNLK